MVYIAGQHQAHRLQESSCRVGQSVGLPQRKGIAVSIVAFRFSKKMIVYTCKLCGDEFVSDSFVLKEVLDEEGNKVSEAPRVDE